MLSFGSEENCRFFLLVITCTTFGVLFFGEGFSSGRTVQWKITYSWLYNFLGGGDLPDSVGPYTMMGGWYNTVPCSERKEVSAVAVENFPHIERVACLT